MGGGGVAAAGESACPARCGDLSSVAWRAESGGNGARRATGAVSHRCAVGGGVVPPRRCGEIVAAGQNVLYPVNLKITVNRNNGLP